MGSILCLEILRLEEKINTGQEKGAKHIFSSSTNDGNFKSNPT